MEWTITYLGSTEVQGLDIDETAPIPDLSEELHAAVKEIRKKKSQHDALAISITPECLRADPRSNGGMSVYQPIGKIVFLNTVSEGTLKKSHIFAVIATLEGSRIGGPNPKFVCHAFKCRSEADANAIAFAASRTMSTNARRKPNGNATPVAHEQLEEAVKYWNANNPQLYHFELGRGNVISGNIRILCQIDASLKTVKKVVRLTSEVRGNELITLLSEKFNLSDIDASHYAVFDSRDTGEQNMLEESDSPILIALTLNDPSQTAFYFRRLPPGLVRIGTTGSGLTGSSTGLPMRGSNGSVSTAVSSETGAAHSHHILDSRARPTSSRTSEVPVVTLGDMHGETSTDHQETSPLGPLLPYHEADEDLLLNVMITRQTGDLGFKLTPAYLLQMCIAYRSLQGRVPALRRLLQKIASEINKVVRNNSDDPDMLLFWSSNSLKLMASLLKDASVFAVFKESSKQLLDETVALALSGITRCALEEGRKPADLVDSQWTTDIELRTVIIDHYRALDQNMSHESLRDVVNKITAVMPSPRRAPQGELPARRSTQGSASSGASGNEAHVRRANTSTRLGFSSSQDLPLTSTPVSHRRLDDVHSNDGVSSGRHSIHSDRDSFAQEYRIPPLPTEWEELIDHETKHRFFANHKTRQTSWTDPRDKLITVNLIKGDKGLGLGISGAKRTGDGRLVLGIFVSSLVPGSAADVDGTLREGDEILEVNGHSLIGVNREGAINFLKQVNYGDTVMLLVSQEPTPGDHMHRLRHTQL